MPNENRPPADGYRWAGSGDVNAFFGLMLDNVADLVLAVSLLAATFGFPESFALSYMVPGTALGVLFGDLVFTAMAISLARRTGRNDVTAMPLGLDTPSTFGMVFFVLGPAFISAKGKGLSPDEAAVYTWHIGICAMVASGIFKLLCSIGSGWIRRVIPRAGLLGSLTAIALVLISFLPLLKILGLPLVGMTALAIILTTLVAKVDAPGHLPGALVALVVGSAVFYAMRATGFAPAPANDLTQSVWLPSGWLTAFEFKWLAVWQDALQYLPVVIPFALATVVGGIDCTESAAAAGDEYHTPTIIAVEGIATLIAGLSGGVIQTTPYIGHPAYKAMGGRAGYTLATALFIGAAGLVGFFGLMYPWLPEPAVCPILIFIGLEISAQSFAATPKRHYPAVAFACVPALAYLVMLFAGRILGAAGKTIETIGAPLSHELHTISVLSGGFGFIVTSLMWGAVLATIIDRKLKTAAVYFLVAGLFSSVGIMHSPLPKSRIVLPWDMPPLPDFAAAQAPYMMLASYWLMAAIMLLWSTFLKPGEAGTPVEHS